MLLRVRCLIELLVLQETRCAEYGRDARQSRLPARTSRMGGNLGGTSRHGGRCGHCHQIRSVAMPRVRRLAGCRRAELGLESGGQSSAAQWRCARQLSVAEQCAQVSGGRTDTGDPRL